MTRQTIQGVLAALIILGVLVLMVLSKDPDAQISILMPLVGGIVGYFFGYDRGSNQRGTGT